MTWFTAVLSPPFAAGKGGSSAKAGEAVANASTPVTVNNATILLTRLCMLLPAFLTLLRSFMRSSSSTWYRGSSQSIQLT